MLHNTHKVVKNNVSYPDYDLQAFWFCLSLATKWFCRPKEELQQKRINYLFKKKDVYLS